MLSAIVQTLKAMVEASVADIYQVSVAEMQNRFRNTSAQGIIQR